MDIKNIEKLEDLNKHQWEYGAGEYIIESNICGDLVLKRKNCIAENGHIYVRKYFEVHEKNLFELEVFGLKVVLNGGEKPKLTVADSEWLSQEIYFARDEDGDLFGYYGEPKKYKHTWDKEHCFGLGDDIFPFITWESGKAWSKSELMELEVE